MDEDIELLYDEIYDEYVEEETEEKSVEIEVFFFIFPKWLFFIYYLKRNGKS